MLRNPGQEIKGGRQRSEKEREKEGDGEGQAEGEELSARDWNDR